MQPVLQPARASVPAPARTSARCNAPGPCLSPLGKEQMKEQSKRAVAATNFYFTLLPVGVTARTRARTRARPYLRPYFRTSARPCLGGEVSFPLRKWK